MNKSMLPVLTFIFLFSISFLTTISGSEGVKIKRIKGPIEFDGLPGEPAWNEADLFPLTMHRPEFKKEPSEKSDIRIGYDDEFLWVGASLYMRDASRIFAETKKRDDQLYGFDAFGIILDTYKDNENALAFFTAPTGLRSDFSISNDAVMNGGAPGMISSINSSWNTFWDVRTSRDDKGWYVEMRIPFSSLKFKPAGDVATMGLIISRTVSSNNEKDTYPEIDPKYGYLASYKPSLAREIKIEGAKPERPVYVSPYLLAGYCREYTLNDQEDNYIRSDNPEYNLGLDIKYNINSNLTLDLTANTDFAQVEADDQQVNLTRYSLFFPEKRRFFQERSSLFDFSLGGTSDNLFYSRNIGIADEAPVRIYGGARITGRLGKWDLGILDMQTAAQETTPGENFAVARLRRQVINQNSYVGGIMTSRIGTNGNQNVAYGLDGIFRLYGDDYLNVKWAQSYDNTTGTRLNSLDPSFILLDWERRSEKGFAYKVNYTFLGEKFQPGIGYVMRDGVQGFGSRLMYGWLPGEESKLFNYNFNVRAERYTRLADNTPETVLLTPGFELNTKSGFHAEASFLMQKEGVIEDFNLSDSVAVRAGDYSFNTAQFLFGTPSSKLVSLMSMINAGQFYDGNRYGVSSGLNLNLSASFNLTATYDFNAIRFPGRATNNSLNIHSLNLKALVMFSTQLSASLMVQYVNTDNDLITNFRLRYNPREGNDFYLVYNDYRGTNRTISVPELPAFFNKTVMVKYVHTFIF